MSSELLLITADFNIHVGYPCNPDCVRLLDLLESMGLQQHVPAHKSGHTLDLIITRRADSLLSTDPMTDHLFSDHFDYTTSNIIYCITFTLFNKLYIEESGRKLGDRFREHLLDVKNKGSDLSKPVARHFNLPGHSHEHMEICGIHLHFGNNETRKRKEQRLIFKLGTLAPVGIDHLMNDFHSLKVPD